MDTQQPATKQALQAFLCLINFCRQWIPDCSFYDKCLRAAVKHSDPSSAPLSWTSEMRHAFGALKRALCTAPTLGLPNYSLPFHLYVATPPGTASAVLAQEHRGGKFVLSHPSVLHTSHQVMQILRNLNTQHMSSQRRSGYETVLLATDNLTIRPSSSLDTVAHALQHLLNAQDDCVGGSNYDCLSEIVAATSIRADLSSVPLQTGDILFVDGSCSKPSDGVYLCGYAVCRLPNTIPEFFSLPFFSAQAAERYALTRACALSEDADVTIYTDSRYASGVAHDFGRIWQSRGFTAADGKPISHASLVQDLITACHLPRSVAIVKTRAHSSGDTDEVRGNALTADRMAKQAANTMISTVLISADGQTP
ncbi:protein NYNRIN-like isoform X1, partial [Tachysurus ichikawai]